MRFELENAKSPLDANLEAVIPGLHQWQSVNHKELGSVKSAVESLSQRVAEGFRDSTQASADSRVASDQKLASAFINIAHQLLRGEKRAGETIEFEFDGDEGEETMQAIKVPPRKKQRTGETFFEEESLCTTFRMVPRHTSLQDLWDEWFGLSKHHDPLGGINGRNEKFGSKWRKHLNVQQYSRTVRVVAAVEQYAVDNSVPWGNALDDLEDSFEECKYSVSKMVLACQAKGLLSKKTSRGKHKVEV